MIMDRELKPLVLVECKAPSVKIDESTVRQLAVYNAIYDAKLLVVTNGVVTHAALCGKSPNDFKSLSQIPDYNNLTALI